MNYGKDMIILQLSYLYNGNHSTWIESYHNETRPCKISEDNFNGLVQDCSNSSALAMELLQSCAKASISYL